MDTILTNLSLKTGDLVLFDSDNGGFLKIFDSLIKLFTGSSYNHIGMILRDPTYIKEDLKGLYLYESSWEGTPDPADGKVKLGVQITPLQEVIKNNKGKIFIRSIECESEEKYNETFSPKNILKVYNASNGKPYDVYPKDWINALFRIDFDPQKEGRFFCSALVGFLYTKLGILYSNTDWSILRPSDFSLEDNNQHLIYNEGFKLDNKQTEYLSNSF
jgi:hypothetical protein